MDHGASRPDSGVNYDPIREGNYPTAGVSPIPRCSLYRQRLAEVTDIPWIRQLQGENLELKVPYDVRAQRGFLSVDFSAAQFHDFIAHRRILVATFLDQGIGYLVCSPTHSVQHIPQVARCLTLLEQIPTAASALSAGRSVFLGPVCVAQEHRGQRMMGELYQQSLGPIASDFDIAFTFVAASNHVSTRAHITKVGFLPVGHFQSDGVTFSALIKPLHSRA